MKVRVHNRAGIRVLTGLKLIRNLFLTEECDDEDDPEYNFLADIDEPDVEDYRDDKAVRITSKYTNTHVFRFSLNLQRSCSVICLNSVHTFGRVPQVISRNI